MISKDHIRSSFIPPEFSFSSFFLHSCILFLCPRIVISVRYQTGHALPHITSVNFTHCLSFLVSNLLYKHSMSDMLIEANPGPWCWPSTADYPRYCPQGLSLLPPSIHLQYVKWVINQVQGCCDFIYRVAESSLCLW